MPTLEEETIRTLLIVDDEPTVLSALRMVLERANYHVVSTTSPQKALHILEEQKFSVIVSDQRMPELTGLEFLQRARQIQPNASRVLITAAVSLPTLVEAINQGEIYRFVAKPWLREELLVTIENAVNRFELIVQNEQLHAQTAKLHEQVQAANEKLSEQVVQLEAQSKELASKNEELATRYELSLELCSRIIATFDPLLANQTSAIAKITEEMSQASNFTTEESSVLRTSARLCDLGLIGVPREIHRQFLEDPVLLQDRDLAEMHNHPSYSQTLASHVDGRPLVGQTVRSHHEHFDGTGYPDGLAGDNIPWTARCLAVAVRFVECRLPTEQALGVIDSESGTILDPEAVRLFRKSTKLQALPQSVREVMLDDLQPGMVLADGIYSPHGLLLVGRGQALNSPMITKIRDHNLSMPISHQLLVYS